jgi:hypothetical protein
MSKMVLIVGEVHFRRWSSELDCNAIEEVVLFSRPVQAVQKEFRRLIGLDPDLKFRYSAFFSTVYMRVLFDDEEN